MTTTACEPAVPDFPEIADPRRRRYLQSLCRRWHFAAAAVAAGIDVKTGYNWRHDAKDVAFQAAVQMAGRTFVEAAEGELWRRGVDGHLEPVYQGGKLVGYIRRYDTTACIFMLKSVRPDRYRDHAKATHEVGHSLLEILRAVERRKSKPSTPNPKE